MEHQYDAGFAIRIDTLYACIPQCFETQSHISGLRTRGVRTFPSATAVLGVDKQERDFLVGWTARGSAPLCQRSNE